MALALGLTPSEVDEMPARDYELLARYWMQEPWGTWRDNMHTAILARAILSPHLKKGAKIDLMDFMLRNPDEVAEERADKQRKTARNVFNALKAIAKKRPYRNG